MHIRKTHHAFPLRPYLPLLVGSLEDTDAHVRDCARTSVVELFTGPAVTDSARADLKKEMSKKGVRKTIVDGVLSKLLGAGSNPQSREGSENGDTSSKPREYVPPSMLLQQGRKPSTTVPASIPRTASTTGIPRPMSRAGAASPSVLPSPTADSSQATSSLASEIRPVFVSLPFYLVVFPLN